MIRVVLDTNIIVSALLQPLGPPAHVFLLALGDTVQMCVSGAVFAEYEEVIRRPRLRRTEDTILSVLAAVKTKAYWVKPSEPVRACSDPDDERLLGMLAGQRSGLPSDWQRPGFPNPLAWDRGCHSAPILEILAGKRIEWK